jgi:ferredoxin
LENVMAYRIKVSTSMCESYGNCVVAAPEYFDLDDDSGLVVVLQDTVEESAKAHVESAVRSCPVAALRLDRITE